MKKIIESLGIFRNAGLYPDIREISSAPTPAVVIDGKEILMFCSNNYLGLATSEGVKRAVRAGVEKYGLGSGGSRLISGSTDVHRKLEKTIAEFKGCKDAIVFTTGYQANMGTITAVMDAVHKFGRERFNPLCKRDIILSDELNHASIIDACRLSRQKTIIYRHRDVIHLEALLRKYKKRRKIIVTDAVFSMDGDIAPLPDILRRAKKYNSLVMVDEAHSTGVLGVSGRGIKEYFDLDDGVDIVMGTLSKALGGLGGYVAGSRDLIDFLRISARSYIFSTSFPPAIASGVIAAIEEIKSRPELRENLWRNVNMLRSGFQERGFNTLGSETQIVPVFIGEETKAIEAARLLFQGGIFAPCVRWPAVPKNKSRIRFTVMASHTENQIARLLKVLAEIGRSLGIVG